MRYQIHRLQQQALVDLDLNTEEALLLDWLLNWKDGGSMERIVVGDDLAYWVNYSKVVEELPILFGKPKSNSEEDIEKAKKSNTTKVARMLKGNLSKVLTRHEKKVQGRTKIYVSFNREILDILLNNKKASSTAIDEAQNQVNSKSNYNKSIPQKDKKDTKKIKKDSEILQVIKDSCVSIKKQDLNECEELFTDIDRLKLALEICENNNSNGIKALKLAYKKAYTQNNNSNDNFTNNFAKGAGSGVNNNFAKYGNDLEEMLQKSQEGKFKDIEQGISQFNPNFKL